MKGQTPYRTHAFQCESCPAVFYVFRHTAGRKRVYCDDCLRKRKGYADKLRIKNFKLKLRAKKGAF